MLTKTLWCINGGNDLLYLRMFIAYVSSGNSLLFTHVYPCLLMSTACVSGTNNLLLILSEEGPGITVAKSDRLVNIIT